MNLYQPPLKEEHVVMEIIQRLAFAKIKVWRIKERIPEIRNGRKFWRGRGLDGRGASTAGISDLIGYVQFNPKIKYMAGTRPLFIEVKRPGGKRRYMQEVFIQEAAADGAIAFFAETWEDVRNNMKTHGIELPA